MLLSIKKKDISMNRYIIVVGAHENAKTEILFVTGMLFDIRKEFDFMCIGIDAIDNVKSEIKYVATYHPTDIRKIKEKKIGGFNPKFICHEQNKEKNVDIVIPIYKGAGEKSGSSALLGVYAAQMLGYNKIIVCGCPLEGVSKTTRYPYSNYRLGWLKSSKLEKDKVRSMSGWTKEFLGEVTKEWLLSTECN